MKESLAQVIAIVGFGNRFLINKKLPWRFFKKNEAFKHTQKIKFTEKDKEEFTTLKSWFADLKKQNCQKLSLSFQPSSEEDFKEAYFVGGGGEWKILAHFEDHIQVYQAVWRPVKKSERGQPLTWEVQYQSVEEVPEKMVSMDLRIIQVEMFKALSELQNFLVNRRKILSSRWCMHAMRVLGQTSSLGKKEVTTLLPGDVYLQEALKIITAIESAWLFSGPLVWDSVQFQGKDQIQYEQLLKALYRIYVEGILASVKAVTL